MTACLSNVGSRSIVLTNRLKSVRKSKATDAGTSIKYGVAHGPVLLTAREYREYLSLRLIFFGCCTGHFNSDETNVVHVEDHRWGQESHNEESHELQLPRLQKAQD